MRIMPVNTQISFKNKKLIPQLNNFQKPKGKLPTFVISGTPQSVLKQIKNYKAKYGKISLLELIDKLIKEGKIG